MAIRQIEKLGPALAGAQAPQPPGADGEKRLLELVAHVLAVLPGVHEGQDPGELFGVPHHHPDA